MPRTEEYKNFTNPSDRITRPALDEVIAAVKLQPNSGKLDVRGAMGLKEAVSKYDTITFDDGALLMLEALAAPYIAIAARELLLDIKNPAYRAYISRPIGALETAILLQLRGEDGLVGSPGLGGGTSDRIGQPGQPGQPGLDGAAARTLNMPPIFFFVQRIKFGQLANPGRQYLFLNFQGFQGGSGGSGGRGGNGGKGGNGENGVSDAWGCREGGGGGGRGGNGGGGGHGGNAAVGGNGGSLYLFAPSADMFDYSTANIEGAAPGDPGAAGRGGVGGPGGGGAVQVGFCQGRPNGASGFLGAAGNRGDAGVGGNRGVQIPQTRDNKDLF